MTSTYTITERNGCRLVSGALPADAFAMLSHGMPKNAVIDPHAARLLGVTFAVGAPEALKALTADQAVLAEARKRVQGIGADLSDSAREWLATGQQGTSSLTIFQRLTGKKLTQTENHPYDPDDLSRCRQLLDQVPEFRSRLGELAAISPVWAKLVAEWDDLCALMDSEAPEWRDKKSSAPQTYAQMKALGC